MGDSQKPGSTSRTTRAKAMKGKTTARKASVETLQGQTIASIKPPNAPHGATDRRTTRHRAELRRHEDNAPHPRRNEADTTLNPTSPNTALGRRRSARLLARDLRKMALDGGSIGKGPIEDQQREVQETKQNKGRRAPGRSAGTRGISPGHFLSPLDYLDWRYDVDESTSGRRSDPVMSLHPFGWDFLSRCTVTVERPDLLHKLRDAARHRSDPVAIWAFRKLRIHHPLLCGFFMAACCAACSISKIEEDGSGREEEDC